MRARMHLGLLPAFFRASAVAELEYRFNVVLKVATDVIWYGAQLSVFEILFRHATNIGGWTVDSTRVFMGALFVVDSAWMTLFSQNLDKLSDKVRNGELDLLLAKPVNSQFMLSFQRMSVSYLLNVTLAVAWLGYALSRLPEPPPLWRLPIFAAMAACGLAITYSLRFFFSASAMIFDRAENINYVWYQIYRLATRPDAIYPRALRYLVLTAVPVAFIASVPARAMLEKPNPILFVSAFAIAGALLWLTTRFWVYGLKKYSSASS